MKVTKMTRRSSLAHACALIALVICCTAAPSAAAAEQRVIVRPKTILGLDPLGVVRLACKLVGCDVRYSVDGSLGRAFLATSGDNTDASFLVSLLKSLTWLISDAEVDQVVRTMADNGGQVPPALLDAEPVDFFGARVRGGYVRQPANGILGLDAVRAQYNLTGAGVTVAVIDTGVDPSHPVLKNVLLAGYDFTREKNSGSERSDVDQSTVAVLDNAKPGWVNQSTVAVLDQSTVAVLDDGHHDGFGHGTMVSGVIHLTAPNARILPLKAFNADGSGYASDVLRAIYFAVKEDAKVLNMSFSFETSSRELQRALDHATSKGVVAVASTGNEGQRVNVYPAALPNVIGVASTTDYDTLSAFSNFGPDSAWVAAPGEAIVTTYPFGTYAAAWGTSFSTPFAAGAAALLAQVSSRISNTQAADAEGAAVWISAEIKRGRLDVPAAVRAWRRSLGLR